MPNYNLNNPYYQNTVSPYNMGYAPMPAIQQSYGPVSTNPPMQSNVVGYQVDGEMAAKAYMIPAGTTGPIALWDMNENVFYMRSFNSAGMPNPLKKYRFFEEEINSALPPAQSSGSSGQIDTEKFATKEEYENLRQEIANLTKLLQQNQNQSSSHSYNNQNGNNSGKNMNNQGR